ncbi:hypothetical protein DRO32_03240 [Candidatus Bathyarchaeota archaeon]|nr:MAG: hypothetical protein DRO32_03240 [Candidatus Bathyarchaeota archaeon]
MDIAGLAIYCINLLVTATFTAYATRVYLFAILAHRYKKELGRRARGPSAVEGPFVSILIPTYNEPNVVDRILAACVNLDYDNYEVIVVDDSTDETVEKLGKWARHPKVKVIHRGRREGWKGGALNEGLRHLDPRSKFVLVFDADFIPPRDVIQRFLAGFTDEKVGAVQGYQWPILNVDENWLTKSVRTIATATYAFDLLARKACDGFIQLCGSAMMVRRDVLEEVGGFGTDITEDWELTLRIYGSGYRVAYDETIRVPCECPSTVGRYIRQQCRWAEGHTRNFKRYFWKIIGSPELPLRTKLDFLMVGGIFLTSVVFMLGQVLFALDILLLTLGQPVMPLPVSSLLFIYMSIAYPLSLLLGSLNDGAKSDRHIIGALVLSYLMAPFIAWACLRGLLLDSGVFERTYKTGVITRKPPGDYGIELDVNLG